MFRGVLRLLVLFTILMFSGLLFLGRVVSRPVLSALVLGLGFAAVGSVAAAACIGPNLYDAMPQSARQALAERAGRVAHGQGIVWRATKDGNEMVLVGTNHVPDQRHIALIQALLPEMDRVGALLVEAGPVEETALQEAMIHRPELMFMKDRSLPDMMAEADWQALRKAASGYGIPSILLAKMQPSFVTITLAIPTCMAESLQAGEGGVDKRLMAEAASRELPIRALEPYDTLFTVLQSIPDQDAIAMVNSTVAALKDGEASMATTASLYARGDVQLIWELERQQALDRGEPLAEVDRQLGLVHDLLISKRNHSWIPVIEAEARNGPIMVAAGALHMVGEDGVLALLERDGWAVTPVIRKIAF